MILQKAVSATTAGLLKIRHMLRRMPDVKQWWITGFNPRYKNPIPDIITTIGSVRKEHGLDMLEVKNRKFKTIFTGKWFRKRACIFMSLLLLSSLLSGCSHKKRQYPEDIAMSQGERIMAFIQNNDSAGLADLFSEYARNSFDLQKETADLINFIDGTVVSYGDVSRSSASMHFDHGKYRNIYYFYIEDVRTDSSKLYDIDYTFYISNNEEDIYNGLITIRVADRAKYTDGYGYSPDGIKRAGDGDFDI